MRALLAIAAIALGACVGGRDLGYATYDALAQAQRECAAKGGVLKQKPESNAARIDSFACERK
ncbi:hypothetical protein [Phenylobacterium sp.]|jgi:hypothetical protein|uniref:hypothetical protein n=1 Tax=Phenylobacterium sp. TaxID=1871053 RepID=UPI002F94BCDD